MSHEKGIEAATEVISSEHAYQLSYEAVSKGIKAYLDASGMVMVPREPTEKMAIRGADVYFSPEPKTTEEENRRAASTWRKMVQFAPNPFQTPEESREKK